MKKGARLTGTGSTIKKGTKGHGRKHNLVDQPRVQSGLADVDEPPIGAKKPERQIEYKASASLHKEDPCLKSKWSDVRESMFTRNF
jgi:hypothetical protein